MAPHAGVDRQQWAVKEKTEQLFFSEWHSAVGLLIRVNDICKKYIGSRLAEPTFSPVSIEDSIKFRDFLNGMRSFILLNFDFEGGIGVRL